MYDRPLAIGRQFSTSQGSDVAAW